MNASPCAGRHVLITGATGGLGQALALEYAEQGSRLTLTGRDPDRLALVADRCREKGAQAHTAVLDMRDGPAVREWIRGVDDACPVDVVIANAGVSSSLGPNDVAEAIEDVRRLFAVNALGAVETVSALAERMRKRGHGRLVLISSLGGWCGMPSSPAYSASKAAARVYGDALRAWLSPYGVRVSVVSPGFVDSPMSRRYKGDKPFSRSPGAAARSIRRGVDRGRAVIAFPGILALGITLLNLLPPRLGDAILRKFFAFSVVPDAESPRRGSA
ncbi:SDR family NAD(P)-dependent oxidoreductase [Desulfolutivibrio sulfoxidireducens]|uniref:SDR family NAD(P)-dependent oxidoreductase n=1 Tax=Desulfolutivibrio sulfoxidireducens TaxID=2773299 RepID=UPI00159D00E9|nr:SDR family NAD(P)-dependent oxidoreductase [Desulfolutivibrio sulfoxidireducens]QLA21264.1 SDR family NAD(P)-dependent oxidoreductase [Desulfolutivibrio sulfoxidireducens]